MIKMKVTFAQYQNEENSLIKAIIDGETLSVPADPANRHYAEIIRQVEAGELTIEPMPDPTNEQLAEKARLKRDALLKESDWTQLPDAPVNHQAWADYRQALRDIPDQAGFPTDVNWPQAPADAV